MKLTWLTDIHLNFLDDEARQKFYDKITNTHCDVVLISGDIAEASCVVDLLTEMAAHIKKPIYFVLGNHDYYRGTVDDVREKMYVLTQKEKYLYWLPAAGLISLSDDVILIPAGGESC